MTDQSVAAYYAALGASCEKQYAEPGRQAELEVLQGRVADMVRGHHILELACGTGYWTERLARSAESVLATDIDAGMLAVAGARTWPAGKVRFALSDAFDLRVEGTFSACFIGLFWSHVRREDQPDFLSALKHRLGRDALLLLVDEVYQEDDSMPVARTDMEGNTYQMRTLPDGSRTELIRNFPSDSALRKKLGTALKDLRIVRLPHYWMLSGRFK